MTDITTTPLELAGTLRRLAEVLENEIQDDIGVYATLELRGLDEPSERMRVAALLGDGAKWISGGLRVEDRSPRWTTCELNGADITILYTEYTTSPSA